LSAFLDALKRRKGEKSIERRSADKRKFIDRLFAVRNSPRLKRIKNIVNYSQKS